MLVPAPGEMLYKVIYTTCCRKKPILTLTFPYGLSYMELFMEHKGGNFTPLVGTPVQPDGRVVHPRDVAHGP